MMVCVQTEPTAAPKAQQPKPVSSKLNVGASMVKMAAIIKTISPSIVDTLRPMTSHILPQKTTPNAKATKKMDIACAASLLLTPNVLFTEVSAGLYIVSMICGNIKSTTANGMDTFSINLFIVKFSKIPLLQSVV
ncbi:hypothetical protein THF1C08_20252 [Vibrio jasicida]|uniref:Uncharacterized protein n=1 Tax=Vibrio jasicida TaxID=766224 RepID=A0AAU9QJA9_9VIBR|nr:hypothetical protein THF1C08_20252 [Vibrio jasicida]CAH1586140.1 hypothetical protein THF1A12_20254 [Vibrio jasicida]